MLKARMTSDAEVTLEANPGDLVQQSTRDQKLERFVQAGVNRISLGIQVK